MTYCRKEEVGMRGRNPSLGNRLRDQTSIARCSLAPLRLLTYRLISTMRSA